MKHRFLFATARHEPFSLDLRDWGLSQPPQLTFEYWRKITRPGQYSGLVVGLLGGLTAQIDSQSTLLNKLTPFFAMFGVSSANKVVNIFMDNLLSQAVMLACLLSLAFLVGAHRAIHGGASKPVGRIGAGAEKSHSALQIGLASVMFLTLGYALVAGLTGAWRYAIVFSLLAALAMAYSALTWSIFRFMFSFSTGDHGWKSKLIGWVMMLSPFATPWTLEAATFLQAQLLHLTRLA